MKRINPIFTLYLLPLILCACGSDEPTDAKGLLVDDDRISFVTDMPEVSSRTIYNLADEFLNDGITISAISPEGADGLLATHFEDAIVRRDVDGAFRGDSCRWAGNLGEKYGRLKFFAFHPSRVVMKKRAKVGNECFIYSNLTKKDAEGVAYDYRLTKFRVAPDISQQVDFVTAIAEGNKSDNLYSGIELKFEHQLCGVEIGVWGGSSLYDVEVAGVRIGGTIVEADFSLSTEVEKPVDDDNKIGSWLIPDSPVYGYVDYVFTKGDVVVGINSNEHNTKDTFASIMGNGGKAMVIPFKHDMWDYKNDRENKANRMYFSSLIRMTEREGDQHVIFPSTDPESRSSLVFLVVRKSDGMVMRRLSSDEYDSYTAPDGEEKRAYGWAAVPVNVDWKAGYTYSYVLDYSTNVGVHDPADSNPAIPIIDYEGVEVITPGTESQWGNGEAIKIGGDGKNGWGANSNDTAPDGTVWWK